MKNFIKSLFAKYTPLSIKQSIFNIWQEYDIDFWLFSKVVINENGDLVKNRFLWSDLTQTIKSVKERFGGQQEIFLLTDRKDYPKNSDLTIVKLDDVIKFNTRLQYVVICAFESDEKLLQVLRLINDKPNIFYYSPHRYSPTARYFHRNDMAKKVLLAELSLARGKFDLGDFENIIQALEITREIPGDYIEIGVYKGDSASVALHYMKEALISRKSYFFDLYDGFSNQSSKLSGDAIWFKSHTDTSMPYVDQYLSGHKNYTLERLDIIQEDLPIAIRQIALCNIDVDLYEAIRSALIKVSPLMMRGGIIILEDQGHTPFLAGAYLATTEFLELNKTDFVPVQMASGQMYLIKL